MKRFIGSFIVVLVVAVIASVSFAATKNQDTTGSSQEMCIVNVIGHIVSIDKEKNKVTVKDMSDKQNKVIIVKPEELSKLKVGDVVRFELSASPMAQGVELKKLDKKQGKQ